MLRTTADGALDDTRERILEVALELIADQGFAATSTREISERLGFSKAALYYHFHTKDDLLEALMAPAAGQLTALVQGAPRRMGPAARRTLLAGFVDIVVANHHIMKVLAQDPQVAKKLADSGVVELFERLTCLLAGTDSPDTAELARVHAAMGGVHNVFRRSRPDDDQEILRQVALESACGALGVPAGRR